MFNDTIEKEDFEHLKNSVNSDLERIEKKIERITIIMAEYGHDLYELIEEKQVKQRIKLSMEDSNGK